MNISSRLISWLTLRRVVLASLLLALLIAGVWLFREMGASVSPIGFRDMLAKIGVWGPLALIAGLSAVLVVPIIPASILQISAGLAFGPLPGLLYASLADLLGASIGFWIARRWGSRILNKYLNAGSQATLTRLSARMNWRTVMLFRLIPGPAYPLVSFAAGYASVRYGSYLAGSFMGVLPALILLVFAGDMVTNSPLLAFALVVLIVGGMALLGHLVSRKTGPAPES